MSSLTFSTVYKFSQFLLIIRNDSLINSKLSLSKVEVSSWATVFSFNKVVVEVVEVVVVDLVTGGLRGKSCNLIRLQWLIISEFRVRKTPDGNNERNSKRLDLASKRRDNVFSALNFLGSSKAMSKMLELSAFGGQIILSAGANLM